MSKVAQPFPVSTFDQADEQLRELYELLNNHLTIDNIESLAGLDVLEEDINDGDLLARVADDEIISGDWSLNSVAALIASANLDIGSYTFTASSLIADTGPVTAYAGRDLLRYSFMMGG